MSLRSLLARLILLCVGPLVLLAIFLSVKSVADKQAERDIEAANLLKSFAALVDQHLDSRISALQMLAASPMLDDPLRWNDLYKEAQGFHQGFGSHVILADTEMRMLFNTRVPFGDKLPMLPRPKGHAAVTTVLETGKPAVGDVFFGPIAKEPLVAIAVPVKRAGKTAFLFLTIFETRRFQDRLDNIALPPGWSLALLDGKKEAIARHDPPDYNPETDADSSGRFLLRSAISPWSVVLEIPRVIYRKPLIDAAAALAIAILGVTLISLLGGMLTGRRLGRAVASLAKTPEPGARFSNINEISLVRRLLYDSADKQKRFENYLRESEERYRSFFEQSIDAVFLTAPDGGILEANPEACRVFGYTMEELRQLGRDGVVDLTDPRLMPALEERARTGRFRGELNFLRKDGASFPGEISSSVFKDADGNLKTSMIIRDMTERRRQEEARAEIENRLRRFLEMAPLPIFHVDKDGSIIFRNERFIRVFGYTHDDVPTLTEWWSCAYPDPDYRRWVKETWNDALRRAAEEGKDIEPHEYMVTCKSGEQRTVEISGIILGEDFFGTFIDLTERKQAEATVRKERDFSSMVIDSLPGIFYMYDENRRFLRWNKNFEQVSGYTGAEIAVMSPLDFFVGEERNILEARISEVFIKGVSEVEAEFVAKDGMRTPFYFTGLTIKIDGRPCLIGVGIDVSDRRRTRNALQESEARYRALLETAPVGIAVHAEGKIVFANPFGAHLLGATSKEQIAGKPIQQIIHPDGIKQAQDRILRMLAGEKGLYPSEDVYLRLDGSPINVEVMATPLIYQGKPAVQVIVADITQRKRTEEELGKYRDHLEDLVRERTKELEQANLRLQELDRLKSMFIASMSHELRTPLNSIIGFTGIILMGMSGPISDVQRKQLGMVKNSANHLLALINDVIDVSKIEAGKADLGIEVFDLRPLILEVKESFAVALSSKGLSLKFQADEELHVTSDRRRVNQILVNLVGNAVKFTEAGSVAVFVTKSERRVEISVSDTGVGMTEKDMERLFEAFSRIHIQSRPMVEGTGLGLYLSRRIAALLGGEITAKSEPGKGSKFTLSLPLVYPGGKS